MIRVVIDINILAPRCSTLCVSASCGIGSSPAFAARNALIPTITFSLNALKLLGGLPRHWQQASLPGPMEKDQGNQRPRVDRVPHGARGLRGCEDPCWRKCEGGRLGLVLWCGWILI